MRDRFMQLKVIFRKDGFEVAFCYKASKRYIGQRWNLCRVYRPTDICDIGLLCDLIWSDPSTTTNLYEPSPRGVSSVSWLLPENSFDPICKTTNEGPVIGKRMKTDTRHYLQNEAIIENPASVERPKNVYCRSESKSRTLILKFTLSHYCQCSWN